MVVTSKPNPALKQILTDLERFGGRNKACFLDICNKAEGFYGKPGSLVRRTYQQAVDRLIHRKSAQEYKALVEESGLSPAAATIEDAMEELREAMAKTAVADPPPGEKRAADIKAIEPAVKRNKTPPRQANFERTTPPPSPGLFKTMQSPDVSVTSATDNSDDFALICDPSVGWTSDNPHIIAVNRGNTVLPHGFASMFSDTVRIGSHERDIYFLSKTIGGDVAHWKASVPTSFPEYQDRCILVEGCGLDYIHADDKTMRDSLDSTLRLNNNNITQPIADAFKRAIYKLRNYYNRAPKSKEKQYYLFVYPRGTVFDNAAVSGEVAGNQIKTHGIRVKAKFSIFTRNEHSNVVCFWAIATQADEDCLMDDFNSGLSNDMFEF